MTGTKPPPRVLHCWVHDITRGIAGSSGEASDVLQLPDGASVQGLGASISSLLGHSFKIGHGSSAGSPLAGSTAEGAPNRHSKRTDAIQVRAQSSLGDICKAPRFGGGLQGLGSLLPFCKSQTAKAQSGPDHLEGTTSALT